MSHSKCVKEKKTQKKIRGENMLVEGPTVVGRKCWQDEKREDRQPEKDVNLRHHAHPTTLIQRIFLLHDFQYLDENGSTSAGDFTVSVDDIIQTLAYRPSLPP